jgi:tRNA(Ile)-lysidine synthase
MASLKKLPAIKKPVSNKLVLGHQLKATLIDVFLKKELVNPKLVAAFSGGLDSCVLLQLLVECQKTLPFQLQAQHVHHGLSPNADLWADFCADFCKKLRIPLTISRVKVNKSSGLGLEAAAREVRYKVLLASQADFICLAHHQDDQAETLLLQLARGAGVKGLAGMAAVNTKLLRPLLDVPRSRLEAYAKQHQLTWIEDESNINTKFDRNFMRHQVLPILTKQYPAIKQTISRAAQHMAEADILLDDLAAMDVKNCQQDRSDSRHLQLAPLALLGTARVKNALRWWLLQHGCDAPSAAQLQQIIQQLFVAKADATVKIKVATSLILQRFQGCAYLVKGVKEGGTDYQRDTFSLAWNGEQVIVLPDQSRLLFRQQLGDGIALRHLEKAQLVICYRQGGEILKPQANRPSRSLKVILQASHIPPWQRERLPLLFLDANLAMLPDIVVDARFKAIPAEMGLVVQYCY